MDNKQQAINLIRAELKASNNGEQYTADASDAFNVYEYLLFLLTDGKEGSGERAKTSSLFNKFPIQP